jgi:predicted transposase/invertase (TIGR01784 family)
MDYNSGMGQGETLPLVCNGRYDALSGTKEPPRVLLCRGKPHFLENLFNLVEITVQTNFRALFLPSSKKGLHLQNKLKQMALMDTERLNPLNDYLFLKYMGEKGDEVQLQAFLNAVLQRTGKDHLQSVEILENRGFPADIKGDKASVLDVRAIMQDGTKVNIEVQLKNLHDMNKRSLFYWSREYAESIAAGQEYHELPGVIAINIVDFEYIAVDDFHASFHLWEDRHRNCMLTDAMEIHFIDMVKYKRMQEKDITNNPLHRWLTFFDKNTNDKILEEVLKMDTAIQKAQERISFVLSDKEALHAYHMREMAIMDYNSGMGQARREGEERGIVIGEKRGEKRGEKKGKVEESLNMKKAGMSIKQICLLTNLSEEEIRRL